MKIKTIKSVLRHKIQQEYLSDFEREYMNEPIQHDETDTR